MAREPSNPAALRQGARSTLGARWTLWIVAGPTAIVATRDTVDTHRLRKLGIDVVVDLSLKIASIQGRENDEQCQNENVFHQTFRVPLACTRRKGDRLNHGFVSGIATQSTETRSVLLFEPRLIVNPPTAFD
jgi:hypothetical protein